MNKQQGVGGGGPEGSSVAHVVEGWGFKVVGGGGRGDLQFLDLWP